MIFLDGKWKESEGTKTKVVGASWLREGGDPGGIATAVGAEEGFSAHDRFSHTSVIGAKKLKPPIALRPGF
jgi:hypothetical protein